LLVGLASGLFGVFGALAIYFAVQPLESYLLTPMIQKRAILSRQPSFLQPDRARRALWIVRLGHGNPACRHRTRNHPSLLCGRAKEFLMVCKCRKVIIRNASRAMSLLRTRPACTGSHCKTAEFPFAVVKRDRMAANDCGGCDNRCKLLISMLTPWFCVPDRPYGVSGRNNGASPPRSDEIIHDLRD
jgi:hypothetical protein